MLHGITRVFSLALILRPSVAKKELSISICVLFPWGGRSRSRGAISPYIPSSLPLALPTSHKSGGKRKLPPTFAASPPPRLSLYTFFPPIRPLHPRIPSPEAKRASLESCRTGELFPFCSSFPPWKRRPSKTGEREKGRERPANFLFLLPAPLFSSLRFPVSLRTWAGKADKAEAGQTTTTPQKGRGKSGGGGGGGEGDARTGRGRPAF